MKKLESEWRRMTVLLPSFTLAQWISRYRLQLKKCDSEREHRKERAREAGRKYRQKYESSIATM